MLFGGKFNDEGVPLLMSLEEMETKYNPAIASSTDDHKVIKIFFDQQLLALSDHKKLRDAELCFARAESPGESREAYLMAGKVKIDAKQKKMIIKKAQLTTGLESQVNTVKKWATNNKILAANVLPAEFCK